MRGSKPSRRVLLAGMLAAGPATAAVAQTTAPPVSATFDVRADFPIVGNGRTFLNSAYITPIPRQVAAATAAFAEAKATRPMEVGELLHGCEKVRGQFARLINASPDEVGLLFSTAEGENVVANGLDLKPGDNVVIDDLHYDTEFVLYRRLEKTRGIQLRIAKNRGGAVEAKDFEPLIDDRTRLVSVAWVSHRNGFRHDMRPLCDLAHSRGALVYADAIQAVGTIAVDVKAADVDFLCAGGYKWLLAGWGVAPFYVRRELSASAWRSTATASSTPTRNCPTATSRSTPPPAASTIPAARSARPTPCRAGLTYLEGAGVPRIEAHTVGLGLEFRRVWPLRVTSWSRRWAIARRSSPSRPPSDGRRPRRLRRRQDRRHRARRPGAHRPGSVQHRRGHRPMPRRHQGLGMRRLLLATTALALATTAQAETASPTRMAPTSPRSRRTRWRAAFPERGRDQGPGLDRDAPSPTLAEARKRQRLAPARAAGGPHAESRDLTARVGGQTWTFRPTSSCWARTRARRSRTPRWLSPATATT
jgi:selenocysteine lyase/cysteine desulfurase